MVYKITEYSNPIKNETFYMRAKNFDELEILLLDYYKINYAKVNIKEINCGYYAFNITRSFDHLFEDIEGSIVLSGIQSGYIEIIPEQE